MALLLALLLRVAEGGVKRTCRGPREAMVRATLDAGVPAGRGPERGARLARMAQREEDKALWGPGAGRESAVAEHMGVGLRSVVLRASRVAKAVLVEAVLLRVLVAVLARVIEVGGEAEQGPEMGNIPTQPEVHP